MTPLIINGIELPIRVGIVTQSYEPITGSVKMRMHSGRGVKQTHFTKLATSISGSGWMPNGLAAIDVSQPVDMWCIGPRAVFTTALSLTISGQIRPDDAPWVLAKINDELVEIPSTTVGNLVTTAGHPDATQYAYYWRPRMTLLLDPISQDLDLSTGTYSCQITGEEA